MLQGMKIIDLDLVFVKDYLKVDYTDEDNFISAITVAAQSFTNTLLGFQVSQRWPNKADIPDELTVACLLLISQWYENRQINPAERMNNEIDYAVTAIIDAYKDPFKEYDPMPAAEVTNLTAVIGTNTVTLNYNIPKNNFNYVNVYVNGIRVNVDPVPDITYIVQDLVSGQTYNITVTTVSLSNDESKGVTISVTV